MTRKRTMPDTRTFEQIFPGDSELVGLMRNLDGSNTGLPQRRILIVDDKFDHHLVKPADLDALSLLLASLDRHSGAA